MAIQMSTEAAEALSDDVIVNDGNLEMLHTRLEKWAHIHLPPAPKKEGL